MAENDFDFSIENSNNSNSTLTEATGMNLFHDAYQFNPTSSSPSDNKPAPCLNDASNINSMMRWFNDQYAKLGGNLGNLFPDNQEDEPKLKKMSITGK
ncbi:MAG: hypothetical protein K2Z81_15005 [Cyanobacteria bacterium]|nr:hypothetical protein [Cyanobacteriota bacterium]